MKFSLKIGLFFIIGLLSIPEIFSQTIYRNCINDAEIRIGIGGQCESWVNQNLGFTDYARAMRWTHHSAPSYCSDWAKMRALFQFDLNVPYNSKRLYDNRAFMHFYFPGGDQTQYAPNMFYVEPITEAWSENTVTWGTQPNVTSQNSILVPSATLPTQNYTLDVSDMVYEWICNGVPNYGVKMRQYDEVSYTYQRATFTTKDNPNAALHPKLRLEYAQIEATYNFCTGATFLSLNTTLTNAQNPSVYNFLWTHLNSGSTYNGQNWDTPPFVSGVQNTYVVLVTNPWCQSASDTLFVTSTSTNIPTSDFIVNSPVCIGDSATVTYTGNASTSDIYNWNFAGGQIISGSSQGPYQILWPTQGTYNISLIVASDSCSSAPSTFNVVVISSPIASILSNSPICENETLQLYATGASIYQWSGPSGFSSNVPNPTIPTPTPAHTGMYYITASVGQCIAYDSVYVIVNPAPVASAGTDKTITLGEYINLYGSGGPTYSWQPASTLTNAGIANPIAFPTTTTTYTLTVTNIYGCSDTDNVVITVDYVPTDVFIPNIFSPNNDGVNDVLYVNGSNIKEMHFKIYNRWGEKVFETETQSSGWDGTFKGKNAAQGVYVYSLKALIVNGDEVNLKGNVSLVR